MKTKILFVCMANTNRSPTFERYFKDNLPKFDVKSCGTHYGYPDKLSKELLEWSDKVYVMELLHHKIIKERFPVFLNKVEIIGIPDEFDPDAPDLIELIEYWVELKKFNK